MSGRRFAAALAVNVLLVGASLPARADDSSIKTIDVPALQTLVNGLGLDDEGDKTSYVTVLVHGTANYNVNMLPSNDKSYMVLYTILSDVPADKIALMPAVQMLEFNDSHLYNFALTTTSVGAKRLVMQTRIKAAAITPKLMRQSLDELAAAADQSADLWTVEKWKVPDPK